MSFGGLPDADTRKTFSRMWYKFEKINRIVGWIGWTG
jgi:hypothetical protein